MKIKFLILSALLISGNTYAQKKLHFNNLTEKASLTFVDAQGRIIKTVNLNPVNSKIYKEINLQSIPQGMYLLNLSNESIIKTARLVKF